MIMINIDAIFNISGMHHFRALHSIELQDQAVAVFNLGGMRSIIRLHTVS